MNDSVVLSASAAVANAAGVATAVAIAAPGAGQALVLRGYSLWITRTTGAALVDGRLIATTAGTILAMAEGLNLPGQAGDSYELPRQGVLLGVNDGITIRSDASAATGQLQGMVYYSIVPVT